jgi:hypothetical protein
MCDIDQYPMWADMIRSDQMDHVTVHEFLEDHPAFAAWYEGQYINTIGYHNYDQNSEEKLTKWADANPNNSWVQETAADMISKLWKAWRRK